MWIIDEEIKSPRLDYSFKKSGNLGKQRLGK